MGSKRGTDHKMQPGLHILLRKPLLLLLSSDRAIGIKYIIQYSIFMLADAREVTLILNLISTIELGAWHAKIPHPVLDIYITFTTGIKNPTQKLKTVTVNQIVILKPTTFSNCLLSDFFFYETQNFSW